MVGEGQFNAERSAGPYTLVVRCTSLLGCIHPFGYRNLVVAVLLAGSVPVSGQFGYVGISAGFARMEAGNKTSQNGIDVIPSVLYRPIRNIGIGVQCMLPASQSTSFKFNGSPTSAGYFGGWSDDGRNANYKPQEFDYAIVRKAQFGFVARIFLDARINTYVDLRYSYGGVEEEFTLVRPASPARYYNGSIEYPAIPAKDHYYKRSIDMSYPGLSFGFMPHVGKQFYIRADASVDMLDFQEPGFSYDVEYREVYFSDRHEYVTLASPLSGTKVLWTLGFGAGLFF